MRGRLLTKFVVVMSLSIGLLSGAVIGLFIALVGERPASSLVDELLDEPAIRAAIEDQVVTAIDEQIELPVVDGQLDVVVESAVRSDAGTVIVSDVARAVVAREFEDGPDTIIVQLSSFIDELPGPLRLVGGLLDREVTIELPAASSPPAVDRLTSAVWLALGGAAAWCLLSGWGLRRFGGISAGLMNLAGLLFAMAIGSAVLPVVSRVAWSASSDLGQRLMQRQLVEIQNRIWLFALCLVFSAIGSRMTGWLLAERRLAEGGHSAV